MSKINEAMAPEAAQGLFVAAKIALEITSTQEWADYYCTHLGISPSELDSHLSAAAHFVNANPSIFVKTEDVCA